MLIVWARPRPPELTITNSAGVRLQAYSENGAPALKLMLPGWSESDSAIVVIFPEHVTATPHGANEPRHLYLSASPRAIADPHWQRNGQTLTYTLALDGGVAMTASATLEEDGVRYRYEFASTSSQGYDTIQAVTDPRMNCALLSRRPA